VGGTRVSERILCSWITARIRLSRQVLNADRKEFLDEEHENHDRASEELGLSGVTVRKDLERVSLGLRPKRNFDLAGGDRCASITASCSWQVTPTRERYQSRDDRRGAYSLRPAW
jgi:hypothetical protein